MEYEIKNFDVKDGQKIVGFFVRNDGKTLAIDKQVPIVAGKSDSDYIKDAFALAKPEIDAWVASQSIIGKRWNPQTNSFE
jgi:hypothetical protein